MKLKLPSIRSWRGNAAGLGEARFSTRFHGTAVDLVENPRSNTQTDHANPGSVEPLLPLIRKINSRCILCDQPINTDQNTITTREMSNGSLGLCQHGEPGRQVHTLCFQQKIISPHK